MEQTAFERSWQTYCSVFGPILEPAFKDDIEARMKIVSALNRIYSKDLNKAIEYLESIRERCCYDDDWAAWSFFIGFCFELAGDKEHMMHCYNASASYEHRFYLPYLKMAMAEHSDANFELAAGHYSTAIICLDEMPESQRQKDSLLKASAGRISCLTMMHRYSEAETFLIQQVSEAGAFAAPAAILYSALGNRQKTAEQLEKLRAQDAEQAVHVEQMTGQILDGSHSHFHPQPIDGESLRCFWEWFCSCQTKLRQEAESDMALHIAEKLKLCFGFLERPAELRVSPEGEIIRVLFKDRYAIALQQGYGKLLAVCPGQLLKEWSFGIEH